MLFYVAVPYLVRSTPERAVWVRSQAGDIVCCSWARHFTLTVPLSAQVCKWVPATLLLGVTLRWTSAPSRRSRNTPSRFMLWKPRKAPAWRATWLVYRLHYFYFYAAIFTAPIKNMRTLTFQSSTDKCVSRYRRPNVRRLLPASDYVVWTVLNDLIWLPRARQ